MKILAILTTIALSRWFPNLQKYRQSGWLRSFVRKANNQLSILPGWAGPFSNFLLLALPLVLLWLIAQIVENLLGVPGLFLLALLVLLYSFGPRDLDADVNAYLEADEAQRQIALDHLCSGNCSSRDHQHKTREKADPGVEEDSTEMAGVIFQQALRRWFAIIFWFIVSGIAGAFAYRLIDWFSHHDLPLSERQRRNFKRICSVAEWPVAQLMTLSLAIAADFDSVYSAWKRYHNEQGHSLFDGDNGFLKAAASQVIDSGSVANDGFADQLREQTHAVVRQAMDMVWRILGVWLVVLAVLLLAGLLS